MLLVAAAAQHVKKGANPGQYHTIFTLPKVLKSSKAVFGPRVDQKLHNSKDIYAFGRAMTLRGCPNASFWTAPKNTTCP
jgi:hypothetical protein